MVIAGMRSPPTESSSLLSDESGTFAKISFVAPTEVIRSAALAERSGGREVSPVLLLPPIPFVKHPAASASHVVGCDPNHAGAWRAHPLSSYPDIAIACPALVSADPDVSSTGGVANHSNPNRRRRRYANQSLCNSHSRKKYRQKSNANEMHFQDPLLASIGNYTQANCIQEISELAKLSVGAKHKSQFNSY